MSTLQAVQAGMYLYGITQSDAGPPPPLPGIDGGAVEILPVEDLAAVVTRVERKKIRAQRSNLSAHHQVLRRLAEQQTVLPCAFGAVADDEDQLRDFLRRNHDRLASQLDLLRGKVEMSLGVFWNTSNIFEFFVATHDELREMRNRVFRPGREPSLEERLELGKLFDSLLRQCRERHMKQIIEVLSPYCTEIRSVDTGPEEMIMKLVCLVPQEDQTRFEVGIQAAARKFDDRYCFKYSGPWAPFDFVDVPFET